MVDELFVTLREFSLVVMPILGAVVLLYIVVLLRKIIAFFSRVDALLHTVDQKVTKLDGPLDTLVRLSRSVDMVHDATFHGVKGLIAFMMEHWEGLNDWFSELTSKSSVVDETSQEEKASKDHHVFQKSIKKQTSDEPILNSKGDA